ncbi:GTP-binding membrane protein [Candidatus Zixiibacteriota bacterium]|nr:GTP-binding membrane protein [candidate division Zixibacteria bacterium]
MSDLKYIRNFSIIAHIDHGKSTLADRLLELTEAVSQRQMRAQVLDDMDLERERGITIKAHAIRLDYHAHDGNLYELNLIDTPGHVDFTYEVSRALSACEGVLLVVDASQGVEAQTVSNLFLAIENGLEVIPVINKIDLPSARPDEVSQQIIDLIGCKKEEILHCSAKTGLGVEQVLEQIVKKIPSPSGHPDRPLKALTFDSLYDSYRGASVYLKVVDGSVRKGDKIKFFSHGKEFEVDEVGYRRLTNIPQESLSAGQVGYLYAGVKEVADTRVGDTITNSVSPADSPLPGFVAVKPMVFSGIYPAIAEDYSEMREALEKLKLNDASLSFTPETSSALGFGFRCGFLGMLHMEIITERLSREYNQTIINTVPNVEYWVFMTDQTKIIVDSPTEMPDAGKIEYVEEPYVDSQIITPPDYLGSIMRLCTDRRGIYKNTEYPTPSRAVLSYSFPLSEIIFDFYDKLKSISRGYASLDYGVPFYMKSNLVKLDILINTESVDALSVIIHRDKAYKYGLNLTEKLRTLIPRQMFEVVIQAAIGSRIIARATVKPLRKNVTAKCYGGDITRKRKLLERQKEGKKRLKQIGHVEIPQEAFLAALKIES